VDAWPSQLEQHRRELTAYCLRTLRSQSEAQDAVQETFLRAWQAWDRFEGRSSARTWLYRIATNVCIDMLRGRQRQPLPIDISHQPPPAPDRESGDPADIAASRERVRLALMAVLHHLPPRQRAVLILRDVLCWRASEVATLLETSVAAVTSALQRARATLATAPPSAGHPTDDEPVRQLSAAYGGAFERHDPHALVTLLRHAAQAKPA
jgi:RNA polymerase sigma-70 factor (ECF subfamily)